MTFKTLGAIAGLLTVCAAVQPLTATTASADASFPNKPIRLLVTNPPGGPNDVLARIVADHVYKSLGQPVVVENKPGGNGNLAAETAAKAPADGYTLLLGGASVLATNQFLYKKLNYDQSKDFTAVAFAGRAPLVLTVPASLGPKTMAEFIAFAKSKKPGLNHGTPGVGTTPHLAAELLKLTAGFDSQMIPYRGTAAISDAMQKNEIDFSFEAINSAKPQHQAGKVRALAVSSSDPWPLFPGIPGMKEVGYPNIDVYAWFAIVAPAGTPKDIVDKLGKEITTGMNSPESVQRLETVGMRPLSLTPAQTAEFIGEETARWRKIITDAKIQPAE